MLQKGTEQFDLESYKETETGMYAKSTDQIY